jgi:hypothetical protein
VLMLVVSTLLLQTAAAPQPAQTASAQSAARAWTGCIQSGSAPSTYRLNLDQAATDPSKTDSTAPQATQGDPFVQLVSGVTKLDLTKYVGKRVRVTGRQLTDAEAEEEAARRPNRQEAAETVAGTGGTPQRHERYVRIETVTPAGGECR